MAVSLITLRTVLRSSSKYRRSKSMAFCLGFLNHSYTNCWSICSINFSTGYSVIFFYYQTCYNYFYENFFLKLIKRCVGGIL